MGKHRRPAKARRFARRALVVMTLGFGFTLGMVWPADAPQETRYLPCAAEDSPGPCYWDAQLMGNGRGRSFLVNADGTVQYR